MLRDAVENQSSFRRKPVTPSKTSRVFDGVSCAVALDGSSPPAPPAPPYTAAVGCRRLPTPG